MWKLLKLELSLLSGLQTTDVTFSKTAHDLFEAIVKELKHKEHIMLMRWAAM